MKQTYIHLGISVPKQTPSYSQLGPLWYARETTVAVEYKKPFNRTANNWREECMSHDKRRQALSKLHGLTISHWRGGPFCSPRSQETVPEWMSNRHTEVTKEVLVLSTWQYLSMEGPANRRLWQRLPPSEQCQRRLLTSGSVYGEPCHSDSLRCCQL